MRPRKMERTTPKERGKMKFELPEWIVKYKYMKEMPSERFPEIRIAAFVLFLALSLISYHFWSSILTATFLICIIISQVILGFWINWGLVVD